MLRTQPIEGPSRPPRARRRGFTLIELLVAMALMTVLTGSVVFIFIQAQEMFVSMDAKVQVYQYARYAFDQMERDLANVVRSRTMEFYNDQPSLGLPGVFDPGEEVPIRGTANRDADPLQGDSIYNYAFTLRQPQSYTDVLKGDLHYRDSIYFKTVTVVDGETSAALVEYAMVDHDRERPRLVKRLWRVTGIDSSNPLAPRLQINGTPQALAREQDLCLYCMDVRFEIFVRNRRRTDPGAFYDALALIEPPDDRLGRQVFEATKNYWRGNDKMIQCYYDEFHADTRLPSSPSPAPDFGVFEKTPGNPKAEGLFRTKNNFTFPMLGEGDKIFLRPVSGTSPKPQAYTIKAFWRKDRSTPWDPSAPAADLRIEFEEPVQLGAGSTTEVRYAAGWVPPALRVTLKIKDAKSKEDRSVARVFKVMSN